MAVESLEPQLTKPAALLRGTQKGLEVVVDATAPVEAIGSDIVKWLDKAPGFFKGSDVRLRIDNGPLKPGALSTIEGIAQSFDLRIVEMTALVTPPARAAAASMAPLPTLASEANAVPNLNLATGSAPAVFEDEITSSSIDLATLPLPPAMPAFAAEPAQLHDGDLQDLVKLVGRTPTEDSFDEPTQTNLAPLRLAATPESELEAPASPIRVVVGPVRSGVILDHKGHLIVFGDVNPGAEVRAQGNIVVLGRLRGTAHAGIGQDLGFILALQLQPQQLRVGKKVARSGDDAGAAGAEIAYLTNDQIVVESYQGKLPKNLASSI
ncbi:MAG TPA: septum site-determining protein MinC [Kofleriaceae bacterium]